MTAVAAGSLLARLGLSPKTLSSAGRFISESLKTHGPAIGTAATVASLLPSGPRQVVVKSAASGSEAQGYVSRYKQASTQSVG